jgi:hypothetical protein
MSGNNNNNVALGHSTYAEYSSVVDVSADKKFVRFRQGEEMQ